MKQKKEWIKAKEYFNTVSEPELVDYAIHSIKAAEKKISILIKASKKT